MENLPVVGDNIFYPGPPAKGDAEPGARLDEGHNKGTGRASDGTVVARFLSQLKLGRQRSLTEELLFPRLKEAIKFVDNVTVEKDRKNQTVRLPDSDRSRTAVMRGRRKYFVRDGDNLLSIALEELGDERFARLLITINRAELTFGKYRKEAQSQPVFDRQGNLMPVVVEDQMIWLPSDHELEVHRRHYFTRDDRSSGKQSVQTRQQTGRQATGVERTESNRYFDDGPQTVVTSSDFGPRSCSRRPADSESTPLSKVLSKVRFAGDRRSVDLGQIDCSVPASDESRLIDRLANVVDGKANKFAADRLLNLKMLAMPQQQSDPAAKVSVEHLTKAFRVLYLDRAADWFSINLQTELADGRWLTIAVYDCQGSRIVRRVDKVDGSHSYLDVALPPAVARQMAREDFTRNWQSYFERFKTERHKARI